MNSLYPELNTSRVMLYYFPIQNWLKILSSRSSVYTDPIIIPIESNAVRSSAATSSICRFSCTSSIAWVRLIIA